MTILNQGKHRAKASDWGIGKAGTGTVQLGVEFDLLDLPGQSIGWYGYMTDKALKDTVKALRAMGWQGSDLSELADRGGALDANEVTLVVEHEQETDEQGTGKIDEQGQPLMRARVRWVNSAGGVAMKNPLMGDDLKAFAATMRGKILALDPNSAAKRAGSGAKPAPRPAPQSQSQPQGDPRPDPDIPF